MKKQIRIAIAGIGNCAAALLDGIKSHSSQNGISIEGLMSPILGGYRPEDILPVAAFDVDIRKVGKQLHHAIRAQPNCVKVSRNFKSDVRVQMGPIYDGVAAHMANWPKELAIIPAKREAVDIVQVLRESKADVLVNYLPVGAQAATEAYMEACLKANVGVCNCIPVFIASNSSWEKRFKKAGIPIAGDDVKSQLGATILHRAIINLAESRGVSIHNTYQLNVGGNTDFLNMLDRDRLSSKKVSKTEAVQAVLKNPLPTQNIHVGPSDFVPWLKDKKVCFIRLEGKIFGGSSVNIDLKLEVDDSQNSGGVVIDAIRYLKCAQDMGIGGALEHVSAALMKHPPCQMSDYKAAEACLEFLKKINAPKF